MRDLEVSKELLSEVLNLKIVSNGLLNKLNNSFDILKQVKYIKLL